MRVLLDTNVWESLAQASAGERLRVLASKLGHEILVSPAVVYEAIRNPDGTARKVTLDLLTNASWTRLMPEAFSEADELLRELERLRPEWLETSPDLRGFRINRRDWTSKERFWRRVRIDPDSISSTIEGLQGAYLNTARSEAALRRAEFDGADWKFESTDLRKLVATTRRNEQNVTVDAWRLASMNAATQALSLASAGQHPYEDWLLCFLRRKSISTEGWASFWIVEVEVERMPRQWLRWATEVLAALRKVSRGTPADIQLATYLVEADAFLTCDKVLASILTKCRSEAPFQLAESRLLPGGPEGVTALFEYLRSA